MASRLKSCDCLDCNPPSDLLDFVFSEDENSEPQREIIDSNSSSVLVVPSESEEETDDESFSQSISSDYTGSPAQRSVDPREVTARMDSSIVRAVLKMDVPRKLVKLAIRRRLAENGEDFKSAEALLEAVFSLDPASAEQDGEDGGEVPGESRGSSAAAGDNVESSADSMRLMEENRQLKEQRQCKICMDEEVCVAFLPCGHLVCCATCAPALNACPICRAKIRGTVRTYMS